MKAIRVFSIVTLISLLLIGRWVYAGEDSYSLNPEHVVNRVSLLQNDPYSFGEFEIEWISSSEPLDNFFGTLAVKGPRSGRVEYNLETMENQGSYSSSDKWAKHSRNGYIFIDDMMISFEFASPAERRNEEIIFLNFSATRYPNRVPLTAAPFGNLFFLSEICPLDLGDYSFHFKPRQGVYKDGTQRYQIEIENSKTRQKWSLPIEPNAQMQFDRFTITIANSFPYIDITKTVGVDIMAGIDRTVRGADAYVESSPILSKYQSVESVVSSLAKEYGFDYQWDPFPGHPESIEFAKTSNFTTNWGLNNIKLNDRDRTVRNVLNRLVELEEEKDERAFPLGFEWTDDTHLRVWPKTYQSVLDREAYYKKRDAIEGEFIRTHSIENRIYKIEGLQIETALTLTQDELKTYQIAASQSDLRRNEEIHFSLIPVRENVVPDVKVMYYKNILLKEKVVADEKANVLIVDALPETHERISEILSRTGAYLEAFQKKAIPKSYALQILLLEGGKKQDGGINPQAAVEPERYGLSAKDMETFGFDALMELGKANVGLMAERGEVGRLQVTLGNNYHCQLEFLDYRKPYVLVKTGLYESESERPILENTLFLEADKPSLLGVTNLKQALILIVRLQGK